MNIYAINLYLERFGLEITYRFYGFMVDFIVISPIHSKTNSFYLKRVDNKSELRYIYDIEKTC